MDDKNQRMEKKIRERQRVASKMSSIISFFSASHFKERI